MGPQGWLHQSVAKGFAKVKTPEILHEFWGGDRRIQNDSASDSTVVDCPRHLGFKFWVNFPHRQIPQSLCGVQIDTV